MTPTNTDLAAALREIADTLPLGSQLIVRLAADRLGEGWIEWTGGDKPDLPMDTIVQVRFRDGDEDILPYETVGFWYSERKFSNNWYHEDDNGAEIIAYRIVK